MEKQRFLHPKYIGMWIVLGLMRVSIWLPMRVHLGLSYLLAPLLILLAKPKYRIAKINTRKCFPELSDKEQTALVKQHFRDFCMSLFETSVAFYASKSRLNSSYRFTNPEVLQQYIDAKQNIILVAGHFTTLMISGRMLTDNFKVANIYRPQNNALFDHIMVTRFQDNGAQMISSKDPKSMIRALKSGVPIWYAPDQDLGVRDSVFAPFFNIPTNTITATTKLAKIAGAKVIFFSAQRIGTRYECSFEELTDFPTGDTRADCSLINARLEAEIHQMPSQYLWTHRRFKTRPEGEASFYE